MHLEENNVLSKQTSPVLLKPFSHQVAGHASMLSVDMYTVCKPLIDREHYFYCTMPPQLCMFVPVYKGVLNVCLQKNVNGVARLCGYRPHTDHNVHTQDECLVSNRHHYSARQSVDVAVRSLLPSDCLLPVQDTVDTDADRPVLTGIRCTSPSTGVDKDTIMSEPYSTGACFGRCKANNGSKNTFDVKDVITDTRLSYLSKHHHLHCSQSSAQSFNPWSDYLHRCFLNKMRKSDLAMTGCPFLVLEDVTAPFKRPCILDLKVGSRLHGDDASVGKVRSQTFKCSSTTSRTLGLRLCGMQVYQVTSGQYRVADKYFGRTLNDETFKNTLCDFIHDGQNINIELLEPIISQLNSLSRSLQALLSFRFYASSLLIMYDGIEASQPLIPMPLFARDQKDAHGMIGKVKRSPSVDQSCVGSCLTSPISTVLDGCGESQLLSSDISPSLFDGLCDRNVSSNRHRAVRVCMIDFAHATHSEFVKDEIVHEGPHVDYMMGLNNLITMLSEIKNKYL